MVDALTDAEVLRVIRAQADLVKRQAPGERDKGPMPPGDVARSGAMWDYLTETLGWSPEKAEAAMRKG